MAANGGFVQTLPIEMEIICSRDQSETLKIVRNRMQPSLQPISGHPTAMDWGISGARLVDLFGFKEAPFKSVTT